MKKLIVAENYEFTRLLELLIVNMCTSFKQNKKVADFDKKFRGIMIIQNLPWCHVRSHTKFWLDRFSRFDVYWMKQTC